MAPITTGIADTTAAGWLQIGSGSNNQRAWSLAAFTVSEPVFLHTLGARMRRGGSGNGSVVFAVWQADGIGLPGPRLGYTAAVTVTAAPSSTGQVVQQPILVSAGDVLTGEPGSALRLLPGITYYYGVLVRNNATDIGTVAGTATGYQRNGSGSTPSDPFGVGTAFTPASPSVPILWGLAETDAPLTVTLTGPAATISTVTPAIAGTVSQTDSGTPYFDRLYQYQVEVRNALTTGQLWSFVATATTAERAANAFSIVYAGTALTPGGQYEVRVRASGDLMVWGAYSAYRPFTVGAVGAVDVSTPTPSGKQDDGVIDTIVGKWTHPSATAMAKADVRILVNGVVIRTSETLIPAGITKVAANNATFVLTDTEHGLTPISDPLPGGSYTYQLRGRDSGGGITPWSDQAPFTVNTPPNQPSNLRPVSGVTLTERPRLLWDGSDPDADDLFGGDVVSYVEITRPDTTVHTYGPLSSVDPGSGSGYLDTTTTEVPNDGVYQWRVRLNDGSVYGPWSAPTIFALIAAPILTITAPVDNATVTTSTPSIVFSIASSTIASYRVRFYRPGAISPFFDSGSITVDPPATSQTFQPAPGWLENGQLYDVEVISVTPVNVTSISQKRRFRVSYPTAPGLTAVDASLLANLRDWEPTSVVVVWGQTSLPQNEFGGYVLWRRESSQTAAEAVPIRLMPNAGQTSFVDHHPPPNASLIYSVSQLRIVAGDTRASVPVEVQIDTVLTVPVLVSLENGATLRAPVAWLNTGLSMGFKRADSVMETWGSQGAPLWVRNPANYGAESFQIKFTLRGDSHGTLHQHLAAWLAMVKSGDPFSFRTEMARTFVRIVSSGQWASRGNTPGTYQISLSLEEIFYQEAADITA
jgi:hypothetical protein